MSQLPQNKRRIASALIEWWKQYGGERRETDHRVRVFVRSFAPAPGRHGRQRQLIESLQSASHRGLIDEYDITILGDRLCCCQHCRSLAEAETLLETVTQLCEWGDRGMSSSGFCKRTVSSTVADDCYDVVVPPEISFGIYVDGSLAGVFPCTDGNVTYQPEAYLDKLLDYRLETTADESVAHMS